PVLRVEQPRPDDARVRVDLGDQAAPVCQRLALPVIPVRRLVTGVPLRPRPRRTRKLRDLENAGPRLAAHPPDAAGRAVDLVVRQLLRHLARLEQVGGDFGHRSRLPVDLPRPETESRSRQAMATTNDLKNGLVLNLDGDLWTVVEFQHVKPGKGGAFVRTTLKNVLSGKVVDRTFNAGTKVDTATVDKRTMQYLYADGDDF